METKKKYLLTIALLALSIACFSVAGYAFWYAQILINRWNAYVEMINNFPWPTGGVDPHYQKMVWDHIAAWQTAGFALIFSGISLGFLTLFFYKKTGIAGLTTLILLSAIFMLPRSSAFYQAAATCF